MLPADCHLRVKTELFSMASESCLVWPCHLCATQPPTQLTAALLASFLHVDHISPPPHIACLQAPPQMPASLC